MSENKLKVIILEEIGNEDSIWLLFDRRSLIVALDSNIINKYNVYEIEVDRDLNVNATKQEMSLIFNFAGAPLNLQTKLSIEVLRINKSLINLDVEKLNVSRDIIMQDDLFKTIKCICTLPDAFLMAKEFIFSQAQELASRNIKIELLNNDNKEI